MISLINEILAALFLSFSFPGGYFVGFYAESEIEKLGKRIKINKLFGFAVIAVEVLVILASYAYAGDFYVVILYLVAILNVMLSAFYTAVKSDLTRIINYQVLFLIPCIIGSVIIYILL